MFPVDAQPIAMSVVNQASEVNSKKLCGLVISRTSVDRGREHMHLRWNEGTYDYYYMTPGLDWRMQKTCACQCIVFFCDRLSYARCPFFCIWGLLSLWGTQPCRHAIAQVPIDLSLRWSDGSLVFARKTLNCSFFQPQTFSDAIPLVFWVHVRTNFDLQQKVNISGLRRI